MSIIWTSTKYFMYLVIKLDWSLFNKGNLELPPQNTGKCKDWRFEIAPDQKSAVFSATWDTRKFNHKVNRSLVDAEIFPYTLKEADD